MVRWSSKVEGNMEFPDNAHMSGKVVENMTSNISNDILSFVKNYVDSNGRGCPKGVLLHVGGFKAKDIAAMIASGKVEAGRGSEGGIFPVGEKPTPKDRVSVSLKSRMADYLRTVNSDTARMLVSEYDAELQKRSDSQQ